MANWEAKTSYVNADNVFNGLDLGQTTQDPRMSSKTMQAIPKQNNRSNFQILIDGYGDINNPESRFKPKTPIQSDTTTPTKKTYVFTEDYVIKTEAPTIITTPNFNNLPKDTATLVATRPITITLKSFLKGEKIIGILKIDKGTNATYTYMEYEMNGKTYPIPESVLKEDVDAKADLELLKAEITKQENFMKSARFTPEGGKEAEKKLADLKAKYDLGVKAQATAQTLVTATTPASKTKKVVLAVVGCVVLIGILKFTKVI